MSAMHIERCVFWGGGAAGRPARAAVGAAACVRV